MGAKRILVLNGPNLDMLGVREPGVYGSGTLEDLERMVKAHGKERGAKVACLQSNSEGKLIRAIHEARGAYDGIVYNPGAHTHYSYALRDAVGGIEVPCVEVHISNVDAREPFRRVSVIAPACVAQVKGRGFAGYCDAIDLLLDGAEERLGEGYERRYAAGQVIVGGRGLIGEGASAAKGDAASDGDGDAASARRLETPRDASAPDASAALRLARLRDACATEGLDAFFVRDTSNIKWLTAFDGVFDDEAAHALMVTPQKAVLHTDSRYAEAARAAAAREGLVNVDDARKSHAVFAVDILRACDGGVVEGLPPTELGIEDTITLADYHALGQALADAAAAAQMLGTSSFVVNLRAVKDAGEIARMKAAQAITDAAFSHIVGFMRPGMTEREVQRELEDFMLRHGAEGLAFPSIVATGPNGANPHAIPGNTVLEAGQCVVLDFGARAHGYCSDMTRTVFLGEPTPRLRDAYEAIRSANEQVEAALRPGVTGRAMHELAEQVLSGAGFAGKMGHGLGHGVGLDIHEEPVLSPRNERPLAVGNVVKVEPGVYVPGEFGMRLEDFGVVVEGGFEVFTKTGHDLVVV